MVSLFENFFSEDTVTRVAYKYDTHSSHYKKTALCSSQSALRFLKKHSFTEMKKTARHLGRDGR